MGFLRVPLALAAASLAFLALAGPAAGAPPPRVLAVEFANDVNPVTADYVNDAIDRANREGYDAVVLLIDTPGGLDSSMRKMIKKELASRVPVVLFVYPNGSRAASAGVFLAMAADVAAMAPETNIGSSTPISIGGGNIPKDLHRKVVNDAAAYIRALAQEHGRNARWAEQAVRVASNLSAREALGQNVVDFVAPDLPSLLEQIDGFRTKPKGLVLHTSGAVVTTVSMGLWKEILNTLIDPNIITLLLSLGALGIIVELWHPGLIFPGTFGAISLIIAFFGLQVLPISWAGLLLVLLSFAFFAAEAFVPTHGAITVAGAVSFVFGALLLFEPAGSAFRVSIWVAVAIGGTIGLLTGLAATRVVQVRRRRPQTGREELVGQIGVVRRTLDPDGAVFVHGELWRAHADGGPVPAGETVRVDEIGEGLVLEVSHVRATEPAPV